MAKLYSDLKEEEQDKISRVLDVEAEKDYHTSTKNVPREFGLCATCEEFRFARTEFRVVKAWCRTMRMLLSAKEPIKECSVYTEKGQMSLWDMKAIAIYIDPPKEKIGFVKG